MEKKRKGLKGLFSEKDRKNARKRRPNEIKEWPSMVREASSARHNWLGTIYQRSLDRSRRRGIRHALTYEEMAIIAMRSNGKCELSGIEFNWERGEARSAPYCPTLDRVNSSVGYIFDNCRLVCNCVNTAMGEWGEDVLHEIVKAMSSP